MSYKKQLIDLTELELLEIADQYTSASGYLKSRGISSNGNYGAIINKKMKLWDIKWLKKEYKYKKIIKICPVCGSKFETKNDKKETTTCSYSCSNTYFRSGTSNPNWKGNNYRTICFAYHKKECVICKENKIVEVHHLDENNKNNNIGNLVPLCPTHHQYWHSRYKYIVEEKILEYIKEFKFLNRRKI